LLVRGIWGGLQTAQTSLISFRVIDDDICKQVIFNDILPITGLVFLNFEYYLESFLPDKSLPILLLSSFSRLLVGFRNAITIPGEVFVRAPLRDVRIFIVNLLFSVLRSAPL